MLGLADEVVYDGMTMASELSANTLHAQDNVEPEVAGRWAVAGGPELWMYLRWPDSGPELVCKVFDSMSGWRGGREPDPGGAGPDALGGRGLQVVAGLSAGRWGHHLSRSRLGAWRVPGKAVWFAMPVPAAIMQRRPVRAASHAARSLEAMLAGRGMGARLLRVDDAGAAMSVLSVRCGLNVWCRRDLVWWWYAGCYVSLRLTELEEVAERVVCVCEEMDRRLAGGYASPGGHQ